MEKADYKPNIVLFVEKENSAGKIRKEYEAHQVLTSIQPAFVQQFLETQVHSLANAILERHVKAHFTLPDQVIVKPGQTATTPVPSEQREQWVGGMMNRITRGDIRIAIHQRIIELEQSSNYAVAVCAMLLRHATAMHMIHNLLPAGRTVQYIAVEDEEIPCIPEENQLEIDAMRHTKTNNIIDEKGEDKVSGELLVPFVPAAMKFYLPQWVAFGCQGELLVNSILEAEMQLATMQKFLEVLHAAIELAPYMVVDDAYQQKRYGMLGQLVNQGRAFAHYQTRKIINTIQKRSQEGNLNRGLSLNLPYFDDQDLVIKKYPFVVIPAGFIMFIPAFVVMAVQEEIEKLTRDISMSPSTRKHLLRELHELGKAFERNYQIIR